jgi:hypothetical protein
MIRKPGKYQIFIIGIIFLLTVTGCRKNENNEVISDAVITGYDIRACVCCGGLMLNFNNDPIPYSGTFYLVNELPANSGIDNNTKFPLYVRITWKYNSKVCGITKFVDILNLEIK